MALLIYLFGYIALVALLIRMARLRRLQIAVAVLAVAVPTWDLVPIWAQYEWLCWTVPEVNTPSKPIRVAGYLDQTRPMGPGTAKLRLEQGFEYVEALASYPSNARFERASRLPNGRIEIVSIDKPISRYWLERSDRTLPLGAGIGTERIIDTATGAAIAWETWVTPGESWVIKTIVPNELRRYGGNTSCNSDREAGALSLWAVLRPINETEESR